MTYFERTIDKIRHIFTEDTDGYDVVDFRVGTVAGTFVLIFIPIINYFFEKTIPDYPPVRNLLIVFQLLAIFASYRFIFVKKRANEIGNVFSLIFALYINTIVYKNGFQVKDTAFALIITFALLGMFKNKQMMLYYTVINCAFLVFLILISDIDAATKYFFIVMLIPLFGIGIFMFSLKLNAVENVKRNESELIQSEAWFRNIFDNTPVGIVLYNEYNEPFKYNKFIIDLLGYNQAELSQIGFQNLVYPDDIIPENIFFDLKNADNSNFFEQRMRTKDGRWLWLRIKIAKMVIKDKFFTLMMFNDITVEKNIEIQLRESAQQLKSQNEALEEFSYIISHDLQEPLRMITSFSQIIQKRYIIQLENEQADKDFAFVIEGAKRMSNLIKDMLEYSKWTSQTFPIEKVNVNEVLEAALKNLSYMIAQKKAEIISENLPEVLTNRLMLGQVFQNLIGNAIRYSHPDRTPVINIKLEKRRFDILFSVKDNGLGFEEHYKERIFGIFQRLSSDKNSGTGMGLAICKRIIEKQGGIIWAESTPNVGSTFFFTLPYRHMVYFDNHTSSSIANLKDRM